MAKNSFHFIFVTAFLSGAPLWAAEKANPEVASDAWFRAKITLKSIYDTKHGEDIDSSHIGIKIGNRDLKEVVENFENADFGTDNIYEISVKFSGAPTLMRGRTQDELNTHVDEKIEAAKKMAAAQIQAGRNEANGLLAAANKELVSKVAAGHQTVEMKAAAAQAEAMASVPAIVNQTISAKYGAAFSSLPPEQQAAIRAHVTELVQEGIQTKVSAAKKAGHELVEAKKAEGQAKISAAEKEIDQKISAAEKDAARQIAAARTAARQKIEERLDKLQLETSIQEVAIGGARMVHGRKGIVYLRVGKMMPDAAAKTDDEGKTHLENLRPINDLTTRLTGSAPTGAVNVGYARYFDTSSGKRIKIRTDAYVFHERMPWSSAKDYIGNVVQLDDESYRDHNELDKLNTGLLRAMVETDRVSAYVTGAAGNKHKWMGAGVDWEVLDDTHVIVNGYKGNREEGKSAVSAFVSHDVTSNVAIYGGGTIGKGLKSAAVDPEGGHFDRKELAVGTSVKVHPKLLGRPLGEMQISTEGYVAKIAHEGGGKEKEYGMRFGLATQLGEGPMEKITRLKRENEDLEKKIDKVSKRSLENQALRTDIDAKLKSGLLPKTGKIAKEFAKLLTENNKIVEEMRGLYAKIRENKDAIEKLIKPTRLSRRSDASESESH